MNKEIGNIQLAIMPLRDAIINHKVYAAIDDMKDLQIFMEHHIYAVWDFMSLLKSLQISLTCVTIPWFPVGSADTRALINEIVAGEEADVDMNGIKSSHFEMYLDAMVQCGADIKPFQLFMEALQAGQSLNDAFELSAAPIAARNFVNSTFELIASKQVHAQSSAFTFGREDLIPNMFYAMVTDLHQKFPAQLSKFKYYLERHIEVDGDHHSHLALAMTAALCDDEISWKQAEEAAVIALERRIELWDQAYETIMATKSTVL